MSKISILLLVLLVIFCCCIGVLCSGIAWILSGQDIAGTFSFLQTPTFQNESTFTATYSPYGRTPTPRNTTTPTIIHGMVTATPQPATASGEAFQVLQALEEAIVPTNDLRDLARRLEGKENIPLTVEGTPRVYQVGDQELFWVSNNDTHENFQVQVTLAYSTPHTYFWVENGVDYDADDLRNLADTFEEQIYPLNREFFGSEWTPGVDNDPHLYIIYARNLGYYLGGYFSSIDSYLPEVHEYANGHEVFVMSADNVWLDDEYTYGILAHEFQHMIHWYQDRNESTWINEGFAELAVLLNGYGTGWKDYSYAANPDMNITTWASELGDASPNYGSAFLFMTYFLDRFGEDVTKTLVSEEENNLRSLDKVFSDLGIVDNLTGEPYTANEFFRDWVLTNFINDPAVEDGRYYYGNYSGLPYFSETEAFNSCSSSWLQRTVNQYGVDYIAVYCPDAFTLSFMGNSEVGILPTQAHSGETFYWSNRGDESDMMLTQAFDFSEITAPIEMTYWTWYDLEEDYDYLYLEASLDGESWTILETPSCTVLDPSGNSYGCGYNGSSHGWIEETVDLSAYAGQQVFLRFEYVTDAAINGDGLVLDDISIPAIGYNADFEDDDGGWLAEGFVRIQNRLPQTYQLSIIQYGNQTRVTHLVLEDNQTLEYRVEPQAGDYETVIVISGTTRYTNQVAEYRFMLAP